MQRNAFHVQKHLLKMIEHDRQVVELADTFLRWFLLVVPFDGLSMLLQKYIASNERTWPLFSINVVGNLINAISNALLLYKFDFGIRAVPISLTLAYATNCLCAIVYIRFSSIYKETWYPFSRAIFDEWNIYLKLSIPGIFMIMSVSLIYLSNTPPSL
jgi:Na+-driven multidrug efflux pump